MDIKKKMSSPNKIFNNTNQDYINLRSLRCAVIGIEGLIGAGKTTVGQSLKDELKRLGFKRVKFFKEYVHTELLNQYIAEPKKYAYSFQLIMLIKRLEIYKKAVAYANSGGIALIDRTLPGDYTFAWMQYKSGHMNEQEWKVYRGMIEHEDLVKPSLIIHLKTDTGVAFERMKSRGRLSEINGYSIDYFQELSTAYEEVLKDVNSNLLNINWNGSLKLKDCRLESKDSLNLLYRIKEALS